MKKLIIVIGILFLIVFAGCEANSNGKKNKFELGSSFNGGDKAITFKFLEGTPPEKVRDQSLQPFGISLFLENQGEYDIEQGKAHVTLTGFDPAILGLTTTTKETNMLRGYKKQGSNVIPGGKDQVIYSNLKYTGNAVSGSFPFTFYANLCYPYETKAFAVVCINGNTVPAIDKKAEICELEGAKEYANSGAPVKIENVEQYPYGSSSIRIQFDIVHTPMSNDANVYEPGALDSNCKIGGVSPSASEALFKRDKVKYIVTSNIAGLDCEGTGANTNIVTLNSNTYTVSCVQSTTGQEEYNHPISIALQYDYLDRISKTIQIEHIDIQ